MEIKITELYKWINLLKKAETEVLENDEVSEIVNYNNYIVDFINSEIERLNNKKNIIKKELIQFMEFVQHELVHIKKCNNVIEKILKNNKI